MCIIDVYNRILVDGDGNVCHYAECVWEWRRFRKIGLLSESGESVYQCNTWIKVTVCHIVVHRYRCGVCTNYLEKESIFVFLQYFCLSLSLSSINIVPQITLEKKDSITGLF